MPRRSGHFVVCGSDPLAALLVEELRRLDEDVVVIVPSRHDGLAREVRGLGATIVEAARPDGEAFRRARLSSAHALALVRQDDVGNIHAALEAQEHNADLRIVIRMSSTRLGERVRGLFDDCAVLSDSAMAAPSLVAAALGEIAANHVQVAGRTLVVTRRCQPASTRRMAADEVLCGLADTTAPGGMALLPEDTDTADVVLAFAGRRPEPLARHTRRRVSALLGAAHALVDRRLRVILAVLVTLLAAGTLSFAALGPYSWSDAAYAAILTAAGSGDIAVGYSGWLRAAQLATTVVGLALVPVVTAAVVDAIVRVRLSRALGAQTDRIERHVVVCGLGNVGSRVVEQLHALGVPVVAVEKDESAPGGPAGPAARCPADPRRRQPGGDAAWRAGRPLPVHRLAHQRRRRQPGGLAHDQDTSTRRAGGVAAARHRPGQPGRTQVRHRDLPQRRHAGRAGVRRRDAATPAGRHDPAGPAGAGGRHPCRAQLHTARAGARGTSWCRATTPDAPVRTLEAGDMLHHVELYVSSLAVSARWWGGLLTQLGWAPYQSWQQGCSWRSRDGVYLVLVQVPEDARTPAYHRRRLGLNHLALRAGRPADVDELTMQLISNGTRLLYADRYPWAGGREHYAAYVLDPDGIKVELVADHR